MFDEPMVFALLISSLISLGYYMFNREKDRQNRNHNPNMKYVLTFGIVFIVSLLGKILYNGRDISKVEEVVERVVEVPFSSEIPAELEVGEKPPF